MKADYLSNEKRLSLSQGFKSEPIVVVCASDNNYAMQLTVTMRSVLENLDEHVKVSFYIIDDGISPLSKEKLLKSLILEEYDINFIKIPTTLLKLISDSHKSTQESEAQNKADYVSITSFYRLLIPEILPKDINKVIYLDCDLVVLDNIAELLEIDIGENYVLAVQDTWIPYVSSPTSRIDSRFLRLPPNSKYFNAGVLVINMNKWREEDISLKAIDYFKENLKHIGWYDQGLLNILFVNKWGQLEPKWNCNPTSYYDYSSGQYLSWEVADTPFSESAYNELIANPSIIHYVSEKKPWTSRHTPRKEFFFKYLDKTSWKGWRLTVWRRILYRLRKTSSFKRKS